MYKRLLKTIAFSVKGVSDVELCGFWPREGPAAATAEWRTLERKVFRILCNIVDGIYCLEILRVILIKGIRVDKVCVMKCFVDVERTLRNGHINE